MPVTISSQSSCAALVAVVQSAQEREGDDATSALGSVNLSAFGCVLFEREVSSGFVVVALISAKQPPRVRFVEYDDLVEQLAPDGADRPLGERVLPRTFRRAEHVLDAEVANRLADAFVEDGIAVPVKEARSRVERERRENLIAGPLGGGMGGDVDVEEFRRRSWLKTMKPNRTVKVAVGMAKKSIPAAQARWL